MDFDLSTEQEALRDEFRRLLATRCDREVRAAAAGLPGAVDRALWRSLAETGVFSLRLPEDKGGLGGGVADAVIVHEELGRAAVPGPIVPTAALASVIPGAGDGSSIVTAIFAHSPPIVVEHLAAADVVAIIDADGIRSAKPSDIDGEAVRRPLDPLTPVHRIHGGLPRGDLLVDSEGCRPIWREATLLTAAAQIGLGAGATEMAISYAKHRVQFGRPIGAFQAVKHLLADASTQLEVARASLHAAAVGIDEGDSEPAQERAVAGARILASRAARQATRSCIQVHGGMGYTWDLDAHLYLKRAMVLDTHFDTPAQACDAVAASL